MRWFSLFRILVPSEMVGAIIGKDGLAIRHITTYSKARVDVHRRENLGSMEKVIYMYTYRFVCMHVCMYVYMYVCMYTHTHCTYHTYMRTYNTILMCVQTYSCHTHTHTHTHTHIHTAPYNDSVEVCDHWAVLLWPAMNLIKG